MDQTENRFLSSELADQLLLEFLSKNGTLENLRSELISKRQLQKPIIGLKINIRINILDKVFVDTEFGSLLLENPLQFQEKLQELISKVLNDWISNEENLLHHNLFPQEYSLLREATPPSTGSVCLVSQNKRIKGDHCLSFEVNDVMTHFMDDLLFYNEGPLKQTPQTNVFNTICFGNFGQEGTPNFDIVTSDFFKPPEEHNKSKLTFTKSQIYVRMMITNLPHLYPWKINNIKNLTPKNPRLSVVSGLIFSHSLRRSYLIWTQYKCSSQCPESLTDVNLLTSSSGKRFFSPICRFCGDSVIEDPSSREEGEEICVNLLLDDDKEIKGRRGFGICPVVKIILRDDEIDLVSLGSRIESTVIIIPPNNIIDYPYIESSQSFLLNNSISSRRLPLITRKLAEDRSSSPWSLALTLGYIFASTITPCGTYHRLKLAILLSLVSCSTDESNIAVLAVGKNDLIHKRLFQFAGEFAPRFVYHSTLNDFRGRSSKSHDGSVWLESGSLLMAKGGVCVVDICNSKKETKREICEVLENEQIQIKIPSEVKGCSRSFIYPLRTCIWSSYNPFNKRIKTSEDEDNTFFHVPVGDLSKSVTDVFGLVVYTDSSVASEEQESELKICDQLLRLGTNDDCTEVLLNNKDLHQFLEYARSKKVTFTSEAENLLRGYYVALRRLRGDCKKGVSMPVTAITTLTKLAKSHAKLSLRPFVSIGDAAAAILLVEESLTARTGFSPLGVTFITHLPRSQDLHSLLGKKNDEKMKNFIDNLEEFITEHTGDMNKEFGI
ncbi:UNVERIFIED_CONTAM: hypothetical protein RMT77_002665 [Armadillidium vulgare]